MPGKQQIGGFFTLARRAKLLLAKGSGIEADKKGLTSVMLGKCCRNGVFGRKKPRIQVLKKTLAVLELL